VVARRPAVVELFGLNSYSAMLSTVGPWVRIVYPFFHPEILGTPREDALRARVRRAISWASALVLMTEDERDSLERVAGKPLKKYFVVPPGSSYGGQHEIERSRHTILVVSRLEPSKAVDVVIRAALTAGKLEHLRVIGDGPERPILEELIRSSGIEPGSVLLGSLDDERLYSAFRSARLLVSMSRSESYGITLAEGLSAGLPIVASSIQTHRAILAAIPPTFHRIIKVDDEASLARVLLEPPPIPETTLHSRPWSAVANDLDQMYASLAGKR
jgi:glycosyltransferase involved in cell wall biosynthesis